MGFNVLNSWTAVYSRRGHTIDVLHETHKTHKKSWSTSMVFSIPLKCGRKRPVYLCMLSMTRMADSPLNGGEMHEPQKFISRSKRGHTLRRNLWGGSRILRASRERTRTTCEWMAHEMQYCILAYSFGRMYPAKKLTTGLLRCNNTPHPIALWSKIIN